MEENVPETCQRECDSSLELGYTAFYKEVDGEYEPSEYVCIGCADQDRLDAYLKDGRLRSSLITKAYLATWRPHEDEKRNLSHYIAINKSAENIHKVVKDFEQDVWFRGLQRTVRASDMKGMSADFGDVTIMTYCMCGRARITIEDKASSVTVQTDETSQGSCMGMHGIDATEEQAIGLLNLVTAAWQLKKLDLQNNQNISVI
jgi:hypothetical protein